MSASLTRIACRWHKNILPSLSVTNCFDLYIHHTMYTYVNLTYYNNTRLFIQKLDLVTSYKTYICIHAEHYLETLITQNSTFCCCFACEQEDNCKSEHRIDPLQRMS